MTRLVDTSVVVKWFVAEEQHLVAEQLIGAPLIAPDLLLIETSNVIWKKWQKGEIGTDQVQTAQSMIESFVDLRPSKPFAPLALNIALELKHPVYDCFFLAMAEMTGCSMITADRRLINRCTGTRFAALLEPL